MFERLYKHIANSVLVQINIDQVISKIDLKPIIIKTLADEEIQDRVVAYGDLLFERYKEKAQNTIAGYISKADNIVTKNETMPAIFNRQGKFNLQGLIPLALRYLTENRGESQSSNRLP